MTLPAEVLARDEKVYNEQIVPKLRELGDLCAAHNMHVASIVELGGGGAAGDYFYTGSYDETSSLAFRMVVTLAKAHGNLDAFMNAMAKHGREHGHGSMWLRMAGIPEAPPSEIVRGTVPAEELSI